MIDFLLDIIVGTALAIGLVIGAALGAVLVLLVLYALGALLDWWSLQTMKRQVRALEARAAALQKDADESAKVVTARVLKAWAEREDDRWSRSAGRAADRVIRESGSAPPKDAA